MDFGHIVVAVLFGNYLTIMGVWGVWVMSRHEQGKGEWSFLACLGALFPFAYSALVFLPEILERYF